MTVFTGLRQAALTLARADGPSAGAGGSGSAVVLLKALAAQMVGIILIRSGLLARENPRLPQSRHHRPSARALAAGSACTWGAGCDSADG
jgi:hypothetical protein